MGLHGITIILCEREQTGTDPFNRPIYEETETLVENVLIAPVTPGGEETPEPLNLTGRKAVYTLAIPKGDEHQWEGCRVRFFGRTWQVIGMPTEGIDALIPLAWNRKVRVEAIE